MKRIILIISLFLVGVGLFVFGYFSQDLSLHLRKPRVLALVNGTQITDLDLKREIFFLQVSDSDTTASSAVNREDLLDRLVNDALILQETRRLKITVPDTVVNSRAAVAWEGYTSSEKKRLLRENRLTPEIWHALIRKQLLIEQTIRRTIEDPVRVGEDEVDAYYWAHLLEFYRPARVHARQIVVETLAQAQALKQKLNAGENFEQLASKYSRGPERDQAGDLGWVSQTDLPQAFSQALFRLSPGQVSEPVSTEYGFHLFKVDAKDAGGKMPVEEAKQKVAQDLKMEKVDRAFQTWLEDLRGKAKIVIHDFRGEE